MTEAEKCLLDLRNRLALIHDLCCGTAPKQSVGELVYVMLDMPEWDVVRAALAAPVAAAAPGADDAKDAARWRAFLDSARIKMWGSAGLVSPQPNHYAHFGMEIWTTYGIPGEYDFSDSNKQGREWLTKYADIAIEAQKSRVLR